MHIFNMLNRKENTETKHYQSVLRKISESRANKNSFKRCWYSFHSVLKTCGTHCGKKIKQNVYSFHCCKRCALVLKEMHTIGNCMRLLYEIRAQCELEMMMVKCVCAILQCTTWRMSHIMQANGRVRPPTTPLFQCETNEIDKACASKDHFQ